MRQHERPVAQWLTSTGAVDGNYTVSQGTRVGRAGSIALTIDNAGSYGCGATTTLIRGTIDL